ncbi:GNAT family N-acetyltransferase [Lacinutrix sp. 5H-3-7-4]|uniref:GNAT family N-acetyltransferase n=1 Tax=Lacinutrix sp. (strain 5H-3-7-4) TaxID=983544 RepID=UPI00020A3762|nr:GNAT family N-acetyltransferase [Lacinutrix sp. 5H-3-7-4]AEH02184.1 GCN5-related N-acetyltransferase [Lacinutrix sp. 5H-3-7-4]
MKVNIIPFNKKYSKDFYNLNIEWLETYFYVEPFDREVLTNPDLYIINKGGFIFFAKIEETIVGTFALMPLKEDNAYELTKMAVSPKHRGFKIGQKLLQYGIGFAKKNNFNRLLLYSNTKLENAIYLYRKFGFKDIDVEKDCPYERCNIKMEFFDL